MTEKPQAEVVRVRNPHTGQIISTQTVEERFWAKVQRAGPEECWPWMASRTTDGYGWFRLTRSKYGTSASRMVWELIHGPIPHGAFVLHRCDNRICCNPAHLFLGNNLINMHDMITKGRNARGETNGRAVLTSEQVREIRKARDAGVLCKVLAGRYGISRRHVEMIGKRTAWTFLSEEA